jgi:hypothetical protein
MLKPRHVRDPHFETIAMLMIVRLLPLFQGAEPSDEALRMRDVLHEVRERLLAGEYGGLVEVDENGMYRIEEPLEQPEGGHRRRLAHAGSAEGTFLMDALMWKVDKEMREAQETLQKLIEGDDDDDLSTPKLPTNEPDKKGEESYAKRLYEKYKEAWERRSSKDATDSNDASGFNSTSPAAGGVNGTTNSTGQGRPSRGNSTQQAPRETPVAPAPVPKCDEASGLCEHGAKPPNGTAGSIGSRANSTAPPRIPVNATSNSTQAAGLNQQAPGSAAPAPTPGTASPSPSRSSPSSAAAPQPAPAGPTPQPAQPPAREVRWTCMPRHVYCKSCLVGWRAGALRDHHSMIDHST